jgi:hypothetical protein
MNPLEKEFVPYPEAFELKQLGFDEEGLGTYSESGQVLPLKAYTSESKAILFSQAFRWFREKYDMFSHLDKNAFSKYYYDIHNRGEIFFDEEYFNTPEEAELACLRKLIQIAKNK